jgi:hypothetical protein
MYFFPFSFIPVMVLPHPLPAAKTHEEQHLLHIMILSEEDPVFGQLYVLFHLIIATSYNGYRNRISHLRRSFLPVLPPIREINENDTQDETTSSDDESVTSASSTTKSSSTSISEVPRSVANKTSTSNSLDFQSLATEVSKLSESSPKGHETKKDPPKGLDGKPQIHKNKSGHKQMPILTAKQMQCVDNYPGKIWRCVSLS